MTITTIDTAEYIARFKQKFIKEAQKVARFDDPGIIKIYAAFEENDTAYYVMEFIEGENLSDMVKLKGALSTSKAKKYITSAGESLARIHAEKINHLDIKPANIMIRKSDDKAILIDFGLAKHYDADGNETSTTPTGLSHGYAPVEQYKEGGVAEFSPQTDIYSLAASLYFALSGTKPPQSVDLVDEELAFPESIPEALHGMIRKAMSARRTDRHGSVSEFLKDLNGKEIIPPKHKKECEDTKIEIGLTPAKGGEDYPEPRKTDLYVIIGSALVFLGAGLLLIILS